MARLVPNSSFTLRYCAVVAVVSTSLLGACATVGGESRQAEGPETKSQDVVGVWPTIWVTPVPGELDMDPATILEQELASIGVVTVGADRVEPIITAQNVENCHDDSGCVQAVGRELNAGRLAIVKIGQLGATWAVRLSVVDVAQGTVAQSNQEIVKGGDATEIRLALQRIANHILGPPLRPSAWYAKPWVWMVAGAVLVGTTGVIVFYGGDSKSKRNPDVTISPP